MKSKNGEGSQGVDGGKGRRRDKEEEKIEKRRG